MTKREAEELAGPVLKKRPAGGRAGSCAAFATEGGGPEKRPLEEVALTPNELSPLDEHGSFVVYVPNFLQNDAWKLAFLEDLKEVPWTRGHIKMFGKSILEPRQTCYFGDFPYKYAGRMLEANGFARAPQKLSKVKKSIEEYLQQHPSLERKWQDGCNFNSVLLNRYNGGDDSMGFHCDNEAVYGKDPQVASLTLGAERDFVLKSRDGRKKLKVKLTSGSLLFMGGPLQHHWLHGLPRRAGLKDCRINLTFRKVVRDLKGKPIVT